VASLQQELAAEVGLKIDAAVVAAGLAIEVGQRWVEIFGLHSEVSRWTVRLCFLPMSFFPRLSTSFSDAVDVRSDSPR
jgi:hypothetical protein